MAAIGAFYLLSGAHEKYGRTFVRIKACWWAWWRRFCSFGRRAAGRARVIARHQPVTLAAMEGLFHTRNGARRWRFWASPTWRINARQTIHRVFETAQSFLCIRAWTAEVKGLDEFPRDTWPNNIKLVYFSYHIMVGLGTIFIATFTITTLLLCSAARVSQPRDALDHRAGPAVPFIANTAGWTSLRK